MADGTSACWNHICCWKVVGVKVQDYVNRRPLHRLRDIGLSTQLPWELVFCSLGEENLKPFIQEVGSKVVQTGFTVRHVFEKEVTFWLKSNLQSWILASRESYGEENLKHFIQEVGSKAVQTGFTVRHTFEREVTFWLKSNRQSSILASRESYGDKIWHQEVGSKTVQTGFTVRQAFEREVTFWLKSNLQSSILTSRESYGEENLKQSIQTVQTGFTVRHGFEREVTYWLKSNLHSSILASRKSYGEENWKQFIQELVQFSSKGVWTGFTVPHAFQRSITAKEKWYMQNNLKTERHMHCDPQMRSRLLFFWRIVTIDVFLDHTMLEKPSELFFGIQIKQFQTTHACCYRRN